MDPQLRQEQVGAALGDVPAGAGGALMARLAAEQVHLPGAGGDADGAASRRSAVEELGVRVPIYTEEEPGGSPGRMTGVIPWNSVSVLSGWSRR